jgi:hypothetical protein
MKDSLHMFRPPLVIIIRKHSHHCREMNIDSHEGIILVMPTDDGQEWPKCVKAILYILTLDLLHLADSAIHP